MTSFNYETVICMSQYVPLSLSISLGNHQTLRKGKPTPTDLNLRKIRSYTSCKDAEWGFLISWYRRQWTKRNKEKGQMGACFVSG